MVSTSTATARPSDERRKLLAQEITLPVVSNFFPIERYYDAAEKVFVELQALSKLVQSSPEAIITIDKVHRTYKSKEDSDATSAATETTQLISYDEIFNKGLDFCYVYARRYCMFCTEAIPQHNYYDASKYQALKQKHVHQMIKVISVLEHVAQQMDVQEQLLHYILERKDRQEQLLLQERHERLLKATAAATSTSSLARNHNDNADNSGSRTTISIQESALEKLKIFMPPTPPSSVIANNDNKSTTVTRNSTRYRLPDDAEKNDDDQDTTSNDNDNSIPNHAVSLEGMKSLLPPTTTPYTNNTGPVLPIIPPTPPSYEAVISAMQNIHRHRTDTKDISPLRQQRPIPPPPISPNDRPEQPLPKKERPTQPMRQLQDYYQARYQKYQQLRKIQIAPIDTYQGRISESTNGCTVISALIVARHLQETQPYTMISNATVQSVIDTQCGPILRTIRRKLGLGGHALIIPSDVHDHLVDEKILIQEQFTGAAGGNIMNSIHYGEFLQLLSDPTPNQSNPRIGKAGATLFFREHVISIVKSIHPTTNQSYYDLIDSMPGTIQHGKSMATRTRCIDLESLEVLLLWYASRKFSDTNCRYIDRNPWDDNTADLDPRVFQGFVWSL
jgi:hypothetical protein